MHGPLNVKITMVHNVIYHTYATTYMHYSKGEFEVLIIY
jgi:hypothetical protein